MAKDDTKPSPEAQEPADAGKGLVAPDGQAQSDLVLNKAHELLNNPAALKDLEQREGVSRSDLEQFARKLEKQKSAPAGPGREIKVKPGEHPQTPAQPSPNLPGLDPHAKFSSKNVKDRGSMPQDDVRNNLEDVRHSLPAELRSKFQAYTSRMAKVVDSKAAAKPAPKSGK
jgi:hypothetical protein